MVIKLLSLSIWMSVPMLAMEGSDYRALQKARQLYTGMEGVFSQLQREAFEDGQKQGRNEREEENKVLRDEQDLLFKLVTSKSEMNNKLSFDLRESRAQYVSLKADVRAIAQQLVEIVTHSKSFRENPTDQIKKLQDAINELKKLVS